MQSNRVDKLLCTYYVYILRIKTAMDALRRTFGEDSTPNNISTVEFNVDPRQQRPMRRRSSTGTPKAAKYQRVWELVRQNIPRFAKERRDLFAKNAEFCKLCILDAFQGRLSNGLANNSKKSWWIYTIFCIQTSDWLFKCVMGACVFHTISLFFEPANSCVNSPIYTALQVLVLLIYLFDIALKMSYEGIQVWKTFIKRLFPRRLV